eukprot:SAG11_NODE_299_length_11075_cov_15.266764_6_plen_895_part_00
MPYVPKVPRYKLFLDRLSNDISEHMPLFATFAAISADLNGLLQVLNAVPRMEELKQWKMPFATDVAAIPNTVLWVFPSRFGSYVTPTTEDLSAKHELRDEVFSYPDTSARDASRIHKRATDFLSANTSCVAALVFVDPSESSAMREPSVQADVTALLQVCDEHSIATISLRGVMSGDHLVEQLPEVAAQLVRNLEKLRYRTAVRLLARGQIEREKVYEVQTWFGHWGKPKRMHEFCRNDGTVATRPDLLMLPYESQGLWIWLGDWKIGVTTGVTDTDGWQYCAVGAAATQIPKDGWAPRMPGGLQAISFVRRRLHWRFRQRLETLGGYREKLETANWSLTRQITQKLTALAALTANDTPLDRDELWKASLMNPMQEEARELLRDTLYDASGAGHKDLCDWFQSTLTTGADCVRLKLLWILDALINKHCKRSTSFQTLLRIKVAAAVRKLESHRVDKISELAVECSRRLLTHVKLPLETFFTEDDLRRVRDVLNQLMNDPMRCELVETEQAFLWHFRREPLITSSAPMLAKVLLSVPDWDDETVVAEAHALPAIWAPQRVAELLQLLDPHFWDNAFVIAPPPEGGGAARRKPCAERERVLQPIYDFGVRGLGVLADEELVAYMLQLAQMLRHSDLLSSSLAPFLLRRALAAPATVGHSFYWQLRAELMACVARSRVEHNATNLVAFLGVGLLLRSYLDLCGETVKLAYVQQEQLVKALRKVVHDSKTSDSARELLRDVAFAPGGVRLPVLNESKWVDQLHCDKCRMMSSATKPLWLVFRVCAPRSGSAVHARASFTAHLQEQSDVIVNMQSDGAISALERAQMLATPEREKAEAQAQSQADFVSVPSSAGQVQTVTIMFKDGDDLRQDGLVLQSFALMQRLWAASELDIPLQPYR